MKQRYDRAFSARQTAADRVLAPPGRAVAATQAEAPRTLSARRTAPSSRCGAMPRRWREHRAAAGASDTNYIFLTFVTQHLPAGSGRAGAGRGFRRDDDRDLGGDERARDSQRGRYLQAAHAHGGDRPSLPEASRAGDGVLGLLRDRVRAVRQGHGFADRGRQRPRLACSTAGCSACSCSRSSFHGSTRAARSTACWPARPSSSRAGISRALRSSGTTSSAVWSSSSQGLLCRPSGNRANGRRRSTSGEAEPVIPLAK